METLASGVTALGGASTTWPLSSELQPLEQRVTKLIVISRPVSRWYSGIAPHTESTDLEWQVLNASWYLCTWRGENAFKDRMGVGP